MASTNTKTTRQGEETEVNLKVFKAEAGLKFKGKKFKSKVKGHSGSSSSTSDSDLVVSLASQPYFSAHAHTRKNTADSRDYMYLVVIQILNVN